MQRIGIRRDAQFVKLRRPLLQRVRRLHHKPEHARLGRNPSEFPARVGERQPRRQRAFHHGIPERRSPAGGAEDVRVRLAHISRRQHIRRQIRRGLVRRYLQQIRALCHVLVRLVARNCLDGIIVGLNRRAEKKALREIKQHPVRRRRIGVPCVRRRDTVDPQPQLRNLVERHARQGHRADVRHEPLRGDLNRKDA